uniref:Olfactory receptor n=1 Tax=Pelodiscus sinensis TaxID=13735 RepID=K7EWN4_PELSI|nr:olfactory receptor 6N1-like [Pelodiscus sinensis]|eukprot:XP_006124869.1 olfactory receptor 6N1-like [Pelodiscus sinensis]
MADMEVGNETAIKEFILLGFGNLPELQSCLFLLFLLIYIMTMVGNILILVLVVADQHLHTPMYFFLGILSCLEACYISTVLPRLLASLLSGNGSISVGGCFVQYYFFAGLAAAECYLLSVMSYDRYLAICKPLHYRRVMNGRHCVQLAAGSCLIAFVVVTILICLMSRLTFCGPRDIDHFFCDFTPVVQLACSETNLIELVAFCFASIDIFPPFLLTLMSYIYIITTIVSIPSTTGKRRAFSTCSSHLMVVTTFYGTLIMVYVIPRTNTLRDLNKVFSVFYTVLTPLVNPLIYSLRNKEFKEAFRKSVNRLVAFARSRL